jgi:CRP/FNR family cyclic AMP-dependent transcriptional regulator
MENKVWYLQQNRLFERTAEEDISRFSDSFRQAVFPKRALVFDHGEDGHNVYLLKTGSVRLSRETEDGKQITLALLRPGDIFGEEPLFGRSKRTSVARCLESSLLCSTRAADLYRILSVNPILALNMAKYLDERLDEAHCIVEDMSGLKVSERIVRLFDRLGEEYGVSVPEGVLLDIQLTHGDIASMIGSTRETVSLELGHLARAGKIRLDRRAITILHRVGSGAQY